MIQPLIVDAYYKLGTDRVKQLRYCKKAIEDALVNLDAEKSLENKIAKMLQPRIIIGFNSVPDIQRALTEVYDALGIDRVIKATHIEKYFDAKCITKRVDGKVTRGFEVYRAKIVYKD